MAPSRLSPRCTTLPTAWLAVVVVLGVREAAAKPVAPREPAAAPDPSPDPSPPVRVLIVKPISRRHRPNPHNGPLDEDLVAAPKPAEVATSESHEPVKAAEPAVDESGKSERYFAAGGVWAGGTVVRVGGVRQGGTSLKLAGMQMLDQVDKDNVSGILSTQASLGGGDAGLDGFFGGEFTIGPHLDFTAHQGPFIRAGFAGYLGGNHLLYTSLFELPRVAVGYQLTGPGKFFEIGARAGAVLVGRYNPGEASRELGSSYAVAAFLALRLGDTFRLDGALVRIDPRASGETSPLDSAELSLCARGDFYLLCGDGKRLRGTVTDQGGQTLRSDGLYAGLTLGISYWH